MSGDKTTEENIFDEDTSTADIIRNAIDEGGLMDDDEEDNGGFDQPPIDRPSELPDVVGPDEGNDLVDKARDEEREKVGQAPDDDGKAKADPDPEDGKEAADAKAKPDADKEDGAADAQETKDGDEGQKADADADKADKSDDDEKKSIDLKTASVDALLDGVPDDRKAEISSRLSEAASIMSVFQSDAIKAELQQHGQTPAQAMSRLVELNGFAQAKPDEYLAWVSHQINSEDPAAVMSKAAGLLGYKLVKEGEGESEDGEFMTDLERKQAARIKELEAGKKSDGLGFGPDTPERVTTRNLQDTLANFISETDEAGALKRPHWETLKGQVNDLAQAHRASTGKPVTVEDLARFYTQAEEAARALFAPAPTADPNPAPATPSGGSPDVSAAQTQAEVTKQIQQTAAAAEKAKKASKNVDGSGQGAGRRPAKLSENAELGDVIRHFAGDMADG